ncbi:MAG: C-GCAxxG-C-C family (seleno)protein [Eubacteriales bacterium]|nr:C-GCAxxG-C-C family (seleno)protein [Eubacteriales bacterium]
MDIDTNTLITISSGDRHMRRLAAALNTQIRLLRHERRQLQSGDLELKEAVTNISHDLRTPLTAIYGYLDLLKREDKSETVDCYLAIIENRTEAMKQLTEELFGYSIITSAINDMRYEDMVVNSVLEESVSAYYAALKNSGITPVITMPECKVQRRLDCRALSRIFSNVIGNAIKYSDGDLEITLSETGEIVFTNSASQLDEKYGQNDKEDKHSKAVNYLIVKDFAARFGKLNGSISCKELIEYDISDEKQLIAARQTDVFQTKCAGYIKNAVQLLEEIISEYDVSLCEDQIQKRQGPGKN